MPIVPARITSKPQYVLHPLRAVRRAAYRFEAGRDAGSVVVELPWGLPLRVGRNDAIGFSIRVGRVFDPAVTEAMFRLIGPGDTVLDVGANIGYLTSVAALCAGSGGQVIACEPHPIVFRSLAENVGRWSGRAVAPVDARQLALSSAEGTGQLSVDDTFHRNMGLSSLASASSGQTSTIEVALATVDALLGDRSAGLMKIDVEGHEADVLRGAARSLEQHRVRDVIFEDHEPYPSATSELLESVGYRIYAIDNDLLGMHLRHPSAHHDAPAWPGPSYLATLDPARAEGRSRPRRWVTPGLLPLSPWTRGATDARIR